ncbi:hypothetical protein BpHYR1_036480 [Brachionus plicatilis]|uniref:Uncharacterized protein n=1 Tax=Brachionus plicatilis TaxID=10195 RepID=A0A3M7P264_BRAPC|nr:hypothetical protein BpHYR1_036480 [Brachionus plicatilis]
MLVKFRDTMFVGPLYIVYKTSANLIAEIVLMIDKLNCHVKLLISTKSSLINNMYESLNKGTTQTLFNFFSCDDLIIDMTD